MDSQREYWRSFYNSSDIIESDSYQNNVGRTKEGKPIDSIQWSRTLDDIVGLLDLHKDDTVIELCCGNGQVLGQLKEYCNRAIGVDFSQKLLDQFLEQFGDAVELICSDVVDVCFPEDFVDVLIIYFAVQHFTEKEIIHICDNARRWLRDGGRFFIGDIPDKRKKWQFYGENKYKRSYMDSLVNEEPILGHWHDPEFFSALEAYFPELKVSIIDQPDHHINSKFRFDVLISVEK